MKFMSELWRWAWSMRQPLMTAFAGERGHMLYLHLVLRWRRWWCRKDAGTKHWNITAEKISECHDFNDAFADALATRLGVEFRAEMKRLRAEQGDSYDLAITVEEIQPLRSALSVDSFAQTFGKALEKRVQAEKKAQQERDDDEI